jgi:cytochrome c-type biogenesis protein CcmF
VIAELGHLILYLAALVCVAQMVLPTIGILRRNDRLVATANTAAVAQFALVLIAYVCLSWVFYVNDFSVAYVASNSHTELPLMYRLSAVWGAHEGSLLLWSLMLAGWTIAVALFNRRLPADVTAVVLAVLALISLGFLLFMLLTSNPFDRQFPVPLEGRDLNPLLQDPGLIFHPPLLYMGYVGFAVAFSFAVAALISGRLDTAWARWTRPWTTSAWAFLTGGIALGSWWAYHELGWGGWWFWDPVENASFLPWLVGTALIHSLAVTEKRGLLKSWTVLLAITAFSLSLLGTFLVRSGVLVSVHAFATDPARGVFILAFMTVVTAGALALFAWRAPTLSTDASVEPVSREGFLLLNNVFLVVSAAAVLIGTLYPLFADAFNLGRISVGPPYFNMVFIPLTLPLVVLVGFSAVVSWKRASMRDALKRLRMPAAMALVAGIAWPLAMYNSAAALGILGCVLGFWALFTTVQALWQRSRTRSGWSGIPRSVWGMSLAHAGLGFFVLGVTAVSLYDIERDLRMAPGQSVEIAGYTFRFDGVVRGAGPNYEADIGTVTVLRNEREVAVLRPEKRLYRVESNVMTQASVQHNPLRDLYASLGEPLSDGAWAVRIYYKPMMRMVWFGGILMMIGGLLSASDRRYRVVRTATRPELAMGGRAAAG